MQNTSLVSSGDVYVKYRKPHALFEVLNKQKAVGLERKDSCSRDCSLHQMAASEAVAHAAYLQHQHHRVCYTLKREKENEETAYIKCV
ncbi:hypothetical protein ACFX13_021232 [Malus domestica]